MIEKLTFEAFAKRYCDRQEQTPEGLKAIFTRQKELYNPDGWMLLEAQLMDSHWCGSLVILPYGGTSTYKVVPDHPVSPRGLASDTSIVVATLGKDEV